MALQVGMGVTRLLVIIGAGFTGTILMKNGKLSEVLAQFHDLITKHGVDREEGGGEPDLSPQVRRLGEELRRLAHSRPIVINGSSGQNVLSSLVVPAGAIGGVAYGYMWWKGIRFSDLMYVTKRGMATAVENVRKHLEHVSEVLAATKRQLSQKIENLDDKLDEQAEMSRLIRADVSDVRGELSQMNCELEELHRAVTGLDGKLMVLGAQQEIANTGVMYLCSVVNGKRVRMPERLQEQLRSVAGSLAPAGLMGLKELETLEVRDGDDNRLITDGGGVTGVSASGDGNCLKPRSLTRMGSTLTFC